MTDINRKKPVREGALPCFPAEENHCRHEMHNPRRDMGRQFQVDGGVFPKGGGLERCDWLLLNDTRKDAYYIELKGKDIHKAISQIENTIREIHPSIQDYDVYCRIVYHTNSHHVTGSEVTQWKKRYKGKAEIKSRRMIENFQ